MWNNQEESEAKRLVDDYITQHYYNLLPICGIYPKTDRRNFSIFSILQLIFYIFTLVYQLVIQANSTIAVHGFSTVLFSQNVHICLLMQISIIVQLNCVWKSVDLFLIHSLLSCNFYDYQEPAVIGEELLRSTMKTERRRLALLPIGVALATGVVLLASPIIDFKAGSFDFNRSAHMFDYHLPHPYTKYPYCVEDGFGYYSAVFGQLACGYITAVIIGGSGFVFINISENIILQMKILNNSLDNIESRIEHLYSKLFGKMNRNSMKSLRHDCRYAYCYTKCLRKNFEHHKVILKSFHLFEDIFSIVIGGSYLTGTIVIALSFISAGSAKELPGTTMASMIQCAVEVGYMFIISEVGQRITDLSIQLRYKMYNTRWYMCSKEIKSSLMILQEMTLKPLSLMACRVIPANMDTFSTVMNGAYSYYNLVNAIEKK